ncbi:hypothetical protein EXN66_Car008300 [Channa argus]|uniref:Uncharacterized protein n=1 Tax=Channa argus TaxID=215402 RepID=A0A6G1PR56_CHAAH|nr:hypothetical protein EXN66_Car008300 [Channa argus]
MCPLISLQSTSCNNTSCVHSKYNFTTNSQVLKQTSTHTHARTYTHTHTTMLKYLK